MLLVSLVEMKKSLLVLFFSLTVHNSSAQGINNLWLLGYNGSSGIPWGGTNIDFSSGSPVISYVNRSMNFSTSNGVISDSNGNLLFYTNGVYIANAQNDTMLNGGGLNPSSYTTSYGYLHGLSIAQGDLIIPFPNDSTKYYLFHLTIDNGGALTYYFYYSIIDMTLDNGLGGVISKNNILLSDALIPGAVTANMRMEEIGGCYVISPEQTGILNFL